MSVRLMSLVFQCNMPELKTDKGNTVPDSTAKFVLLALSDHANDEGEGSYPSIKRLCQKTNLSTATVCNAVNALRTNGFLELVGKSKMETNNYTILVAKILEFQPLESDDFSHWNRSVLAAEMESSFNHELNQRGEGKPSRAKSSPNKSPDPRLKHLAIAGYKEIARLNIPIAWRDDVINAVGSEPENVKAWLDLVKSWVGRKWNPGNVEGMLKAFSNGGIKPLNNGQRNGEPAQRIPRGV